MAVRPVEGALHGLVEIGDCAIAANLRATPNMRTRFTQNDPELIDLGKLLDWVIARQDYQIPAGLQRSPDQYSGWNALHLDSRADRVPNP